MLLRSPASDLPACSSGDPAGGPFPAQELEMAAGRSPSFIAKRKEQLYKGFRSGDRLARTPVR